MRFWLVLAALAALCGSAHSAFAKSYRLTPSSKWLMDYEADGCRLARAFGTGDDQIVAQFVRYEPGPFLDVTASGKRLETFGQKPPVRIRFGTSGEPVRSDVMTGTAGTTPALFLGNHRADNLNMHDFSDERVMAMSPDERLRLMTVAPAQEAAVTEVLLQVGTNRFELVTGSMGPPLAAMRQCVTDLVKVWGLDPAEQAALVTPPRPKSKPGTWLQSYNYPMSNLLRGEQAIIRFRLMIDAAGTPTACNIQQTIGDKAFAETTCRYIMQRARFEPARNAAGAPRASYYVNTVRWVVE